jgi:hypothetical protein
MTIHEFLLTAIEILESLENYDSEVRLVMFAFTVFINFDLSGRYNIKCYYWDNL